MNEMKISVITATYNCRETIEGALASVRGQTWPHVEHVVVDGASSDGTRELLEQYRESIARLISEPDNGIYEALNKGVWAATGDVVGFLHADDVFASSDVLARVAAAFSDRSVQAVYGDLQYVLKADTDRVLRDWKSTPFRPALLKRGWMPPHPSLYVRRELYDAIGGFDTRYSIAADYLSILQLFSRPDFHAVHVPEVFVRMRTGGASNRSLKNILRKSREDLHVLRRTGVGGIGTLLLKNFSKVSQFF